METKQDLAKRLGISRKTLYNYLNELNINDLNEENILLLEEYTKGKNKSKEVSKAALLEELEKIKTQNLELTKKNEFLEKGQKILLDQIEYYHNSIDSEIKEIKQNMILLLSPPKEEKKSLFSRFFKIK